MYKTRKCRMEAELEDVSRKGGDMFDGQDRVQQRLF